MQKQSNWYFGWFSKSAAIAFDQIIGPNYIIITIKL